RTLCCRVVRGPRGRGSEKGGQETCATPHACIPLPWDTGRIGHGLRTRTACTDLHGSEQERVRREAESMLSAGSGPAVAGTPSRPPSLLSDLWKSVHAVRATRCRGYPGPWAIASFAKSAGGPHLVAQELQGHVELTVLELRLLLGRPVAARDDLG